MGRCPVEDTHADPGASATASGAVWPQQGRFAGSPPLHACIEARIEGIRAAMHDPDAYDSPEECARAIRGLEKLLEARPWDVLGPRHIQVLGGPSVMVSIVAGAWADAADVAPLEAADWNWYLNDLRRYVEQREAQHVEDGASWVREWLPSRILSRQMQLG